MVSPHLGRILDYVRVGEDEAFLAQDDAAALPRLSPLPVGFETREEVPFQRLPIDEALGVDADDGGPN